MKIKDTETIDNLRKWQYSLFEMRDNTREYFNHEWLREVVSRIDDYERYLQNERKKSENKIMNKK